MPLGYSKVDTFKNCVFMVKHLKIYLLLFIVLIFNIIYLVFVYHQFSNKLYFT